MHYPIGFTSKSDLWKLKLLILMQSPPGSFIMNMLAFNLQSALTCPLSNQLPGLIQFQKKQHLLGAYYMSCMVTGRNSVSELSSSPIHTFCFYYPMASFPQLFSLTSCSLPLYIILISRDFCQSIWKANVCFAP